MRNGKFLSVCTLIFGLCLIFTGCGDDEETVDPRDLLLGSWEVLSIDGESLLQYFRNDADFGDLTSVSAEFVFFDSGTMIVNMSMGATVRDSVDFTEWEASFDMIFKLKATYTLAGSKLVWVFEEGKAEINAEMNVAPATKLRYPEVDWDAVEAELSEKFAEEFDTTTLSQDLSADFFLDTDSMTWEVIGDRLFLDDGDEETVLIRN